MFRPLLMRRFILLAALSRSPTQVKERLSAGQAWLSNNPKMFRQPSRISFLKKTVEISFGSSDITQPRRFRELQQDAAQVPNARVVGLRAASLQNVSIHRLAVQESS